MVSQCLNKSEAGHGGQRRPATTTCTTPYPRQHPASSADRTFFHRHDDTTALGWLIIYLCRDLPQTERRIGWRLVERWARQLVESRIARTTGAA